jgi:tRNA(adenine34) deaminase
VGLDAARDEEPMEPTDADLDAAFMAEALALATAAAAEGEVPVGAVFTLGGVRVAGAANSREAARDPTGHAEVMALRAASRALARWRLGGTLYVTLEPCLMCAGAIVLARVERVVFAATDPKAGAVVSLYRALEDGRLNHRCIVTGGVGECEARALLQAFFRARRQR